jgi:phosphoesterase RecJ-like protein
MPLARLQLLGRALGKIERYDFGVLSLAVLDVADFEAVGAEPSHSEGIIDELRKLSGTKVAMLVREIPSGPREGQWKASLRATDDDVDVSVIAREHGGGGHRRAAGFTTTLALDELIAGLRSAIAAQLDGEPAASVA